MTHFRVDVIRDTGEVMLYMDLPCGANQSWVGRIPLE
jgi:hypothetical protein